MFSISEYINCETSTIEYHAVLEEMSYQAVKRHGGTLNVYCQVKEANLKCIHTI